MSKYEALRNKYPEVISLDQLYRICKIAKRSAKYLLQNGIIPCSDSGKPTHRYKIKLSDVIAYLDKRDEIGTMIPRGAVTSNRGHPIVYQDCFAAYVPIGEEESLLDYFRHRMKKYPEVMVSSDLSDVIGLRVQTVQRYLQNGTLRAISSEPKYLIPKTYFLEFVVSRTFMEAKSKSIQFQNVLGGYQKWITAK